MSKFKFVLITVLFAMFFVPPLSSQVQIRWWFDTFDACFGQSAIGDVDGDGHYEIVFGCYRNDSCVYVLNAEDGSLLYKFNLKGTIEGCNDSAPLLFDVNSDGALEIIVAASCNPKTFCFDGRTGSLVWEAPTRGSDSPPSIADLNGDGSLEVIHGQFGGYVVCLDAKTGAKLWELTVDPNSWIQTAPTIADLNNDNQLDFVVATWNFDNDNKIVAYNGRTLQPLWRTKLDGVVYHGTTITDLDGDEIFECIISDYSGKLYAINSVTGEIKWTFSTLYYAPSPVVVADLNLDGKCEILFSSWFKLYCLNNIGDSLWVYNVPDYGNIFRGVALADVSGDDKFEIVFGSSNGSVYILNGEDGKLIHSINLKDSIGKSFEIDHCPVVADFDKDGFPELFIVGGYSEYPNFQNNYGRAYAMTITDKNSTSEWLMFQLNHLRNPSLCETEHLSVKQNLFEPIETINVLTEIYSLLGQKVLSFSENIINIDEELRTLLPNGVFLVIQKAGNTIEQKRIIIFDGLVFQN